jgi:hypothetical protein
MKNTDPTDRCVFAARGDGKKIHSSCHHFLCGCFITPWQRLNPEQATLPLHPQGLRSDCVSSLGMSFFFCSEPEPAMLVIM